MRPVHLRVELRQRVEPLLQGWVRGEERRGGVARERWGEEEGVHAFGLAKVGARNLAHVAGDVDQAPKNDARKAIRNGPRSSQPTAEEASVFLADAESRLLDLGVKASHANWVQENFITEDTEQIAADANQALNALSVDLAKKAQRFDGVKLPPVMARKMLLLKLAAGFPAPVETLRQQIKAADALLFACPEYNYSMSGVLKNAIDWASRPPDQPFAGKPLAIISAAAGMAGGARSQLHLRQSCVFLDMHPLNKPEVLIFQAQNKFDANGELTDDVARRLIGDLLAALLSWTRQFGGK